MSLWRDELKPSGATAVAVAALGMVSILSLDRAFAEPTYLLTVVPAVCFGAATALTLGRWSLGGSAALLGLLAAGTLPLLFARDLTAGGLPTSSAFRLIGTLLSSGLSGVVSEAAPVPVEPRFLAVIWCAGLILGFLGAAWMVVGRPIGAVVTCLGVIAFSGSVGEGGGRDVYAFAAVVCTALFFLTEGRQRIAAWAKQRIRIPAALGIPTVLGASVVALFAPMMLDTESPVLNLESAFRPRLVIIKPLSDIQRQLKVDPPIEVMRVRADRSAYWRLTALDTYDGDEWFLEARPKSAKSGELALPEPAPKGEVVEQRYTITSLLAPWLPAAYAAEHVDAAVAFELDEPSQTLLIKGNTVPNLAYTIRSRFPAEGSAVPSQLEPSDDDRERRFARYARPVIGDARTAFDVAARLERHFRGYTYDEEVAGGHTVRRLEEFLRQRRGFCEQFAATMTLMLRGLGVDARVGVGFLPGATAQGQHIVSTRDAHAWVEVNLPSVGWVPFDPTPGRGQPAGGEAPSEPVPSTPEPAGIPTTEPEPTPVAEEEPVEEPAGAPAGGIPGWLVPVALVALVLAAPAAAKAVRRNLRRGQAPAGAVLGAFAELTDRAADLGRRTAPEETQREFHQRVFDGLAPDGAGSAARVADLAAVALYAGRPVTTAEAVEAWRSTGVALSALRRASPPWRRAVAFLDPRTLLNLEWLRRPRRVAQAPTG